MGIPKALYQDLGIDTSTKKFKKYYDAGLLDKIDEQYIKEVKDFWLRYYEKNIDPVLHLAFYNLTGLKKVEVIPGSEMWREVIPYFNNLNMLDGYSDKNLYDNLVNHDSSAETVLKCVYGNYFDNDNNNIDESVALNIIKNYTELIIKPSNTIMG